MIFYETHKKKFVHILHALILGSAYSTEYLLHRDSALYLKRKLLRYERRQCNALTIQEKRPMQCDIFLSDNEFSACFIVGFTPSHSSSGVLAYFSAVSSISPYLIASAVSLNFSAAAIALNFLVF